MMALSLTVRGKTDGKKTDEDTQGATGGPSGGILRQEHILVKYSPEGNHVFDEAITDALKED